MEYFKNNLNAKEFPIITEHRPLSWWVDRLLPFQFKNWHIPGAKVSLVDYFSCDPYQAAKICAKYKDKFLFATLSNIKWDAKLLQLFQPIFCLNSI